MGKETNYFELRKLSSQRYENVKIPPKWIIKELNTKNTTILDYGCGYGQILKGIRNLGYEYTYGVDIEKTAIKYCLSQGFNVKKLDLSNLTNPFSLRFDIVILSHVIEHIPKKEIIPTLITIRNNFLASNGKVLIAVPNAQSNTNSYWAYEDWTHTTLFTSGSIYYVLKAAGFDSVKFLDIDCTAGRNFLMVLAKKILLFIYKMNRKFWNTVTNSSYHKESPDIFSYEIKVKAQ